jgi:hypothetical protein
MFRFVLGSCLAFFTGSLEGFSQIINVENARMHSDTTGWMGSLGMNMSLTKNTEEIFMIQLNAHAQYKTKKDLFLILGNYGFLSGGSQNLINNSFVHLRYNRKLNAYLRLELFSQILQNPVTKIDYRYLAGVGPRFKVFDGKKFRLYGASLLMYEQEKEITKPIVTHYNWRSSSYVSFSYVPNEHTELINTVFYQPLFTDISDYRLLEQFKFSVKAGKRLALAVNANYLFDNFPVAGVPDINYTFSTGIEYHF